ncbi:DegT/DnrJ/EryC1/StrS family aminotransferase [Shewanella sp. ENK2]|uniref:DegT/DnrJ/EryC1/StrS family aminotransferase n=1 Tax=Shewanella sp. ENK2 TaxID=2775245 RepID=UPI00374A4A05
MIPLVSVALPPKEILMPKLEEALYGGAPINEGEAVYKFEHKFISKFGLPTTSLSMSSGTAALHTALILAGVSADDEVITTSLTAEPTNLAIKFVGADPVFADVDLQSGNLSAKAIEASITDRTKAVIVVHYAGYPADIVRIRQICDKYDLVLIEDCAHALGAKVEGRSVGTFGDYAIFSFQAIKHFTTVDGGFLVCKHSDNFIRAKKVRWFGMEKGVARTKLDITEVGYKYNYQNVFAAIGLVQLDYISERLDAHIFNGKYFDRHFEKVIGLNFAKSPKNAEPSYWLYTLICEDALVATELEAYLNSSGISASKLHKLNHNHKVFDCALEMSETNDLYSRMLHIPCGWWVNEQERVRIVAAVCEGVKYAKSLQSPTV